MLIRGATEADAASIVLFRTRLCASYVGEDAIAEHPDFADRVAARYLELLASNTHRFLVAEDAGRLLGCVSATLEITLPGPFWPGVAGTVHDMWVEDDARGRGVARALMDAILGWIRSRGAAKVKLHSTPAAVEVYRRLGFHVAEAQPGDDDFPVMWLDFPEE